MSEWSEAKDPSSGRTYYYNKVTKATSWTKPAEMGAAAAPVAAAPAPGGGADPDNVAANWNETTDPRSGKVYFYNKVTKKTSWTKPACMTAGTTTVTTAVATPVAATPAAATPAAATPAAGEWAEVKDPNSGKSYWYNKQTKATTWKNPYDPANAASAVTTAATAAPAVAVTAKPNAPEPARAPASPLMTPAQPVSPVGDKKVDLKALAAEEEAAAKKKEDEEPAQKLELNDSDSDDGKKKQNAQAPSGPAAKAGTATGKKKTDSDDEQEEPTHEFKFAKHRKGFFARFFRTGQHHDEKKLLSFKKSMIKKALLKQNRDLDAEAVQNFKNVMSYMGDRSSSKGPIDHAKKMLANLMIAPAGLRDEVYMQLCKQTTENPKVDSTVKGWELMVYCLSTFPPSKHLKTFLQAFIDKNMADDTRPQVQALAKYCNERMPVIVKMGQRKHVPSKVELECLKKMQPVPIKINLINGEQKTFTVDSYTMVSDVNALMAKKQNLTCDTPFALYESAGDNVERILDPKERVLDILASWENAEREDKEKKEKPDTSKDAKAAAAAAPAGGRLRFHSFLYKAKLVLKTTDPDVAADTEAVNLIYLQAVHDVVSWRYPVQEKDITVLSALQLQASYGNYKDDTNTESWTLNKLDEIMPQHLLQKKGSAKGKKDEKACKEWAQKIMTKYQKVSGFSAQEAKLNYLDYVQEWVFYGATFFVVEQRQFKDYPSPLTLGITCEGVLLMHPEKKNVLENYQYTDIVTWGHSDEKFIVVVGNIVQQRKLIFKTNDGKSMNHLIHDYVKFKVKAKPGAAPAAAPAATA